MKSKLSYWQIFRLILVLYFVYLTGNLFRIWDVYQYNASAEFLPGVALALTVWCVLAALTALIVYVFIGFTGWLGRAIKWEIKYEHVFLYAAFIILVGGIIWVVKKLIWPDTQLTLSIALAFFAADVVISIFPAWFFRSRAEQGMGTVQKSITPVVWIIVIMLAISVPVTSYQIWQERKIILTDRSHSTGKHQPLVTFVFDDGYETTYTKAKLIFKSQGEVACAGITIDFIGRKKRMTADQIMELQNDGWEILGHSITHPDLTALTGEEIEHELKASKEGLEELGFKVINFVYPFYRHNATARTVAKKYYRSARSGDKFKTGFNINPNILRKYALSAIDIENFDSVEALKGLVDSAEESNSWLMITYHNVISHREIMLNTIIDYIQDKGIRILTINQGLDLVDKKESVMAELLFILNEDSPFHILRSVHIVSQRLLDLFH